MLRIVLIYVDTSFLFPCFFHFVPTLFFDVQSQLRKTTLPAQFAPGAVFMIDCVNQTGSTQHF